MTRAGGAGGNPFSAASDPERHVIWERLVRVDGEAFVAGDWSRIAGDFDAEHFEGVRCGGSANPDQWHVAFPTLDAYRDSWLDASRNYLLRRFAGGMTHLQAVLIRTHLTEIEITGDRALCHKQFYTALPLEDGSVLSDTGQTVFRLHRRPGSPWGWRVVGFVGQLPLEA